MNKRYKTNLESLSYKSARKLKQTLSEINKNILQLPEGVPTHYYYVTMHRDLANTLDDISDAKKEIKQQQKKKHKNTLPKSRLLQMRNFWFNIMKERGLCYCSAKVNGGRTCGFYTDGLHDLCTRHRNMATKRKKKNWYKCF
jgi:hypothetical protein